MFTKKKSLKQIASLGAVALAATLSLSACSAEPSTTVLKLDQAGVESTLTYYAEGDKVVRQTTKNVVTYSEAGLPDKETAKKILDEGIKKYQGIEGLSDTVEYGDKEAVETVEVDYSKADYKELAKAGVVAGDSGQAAEDVNEVSLEKSLEQIKKLGYTEQEEAAK